MRTFWALPVLLTAIFMVGCASLGPQLERPTVKVTSIGLLPGESLRQGIQVGLLLNNPNDIPLDIKGMSYKLIIEGHNIADGVIADVPEAPAYGSAEFIVPVTLNLFNGLKLVRSLAGKTNLDTVEYRLEAKLETGWMLLPKLVVTEEGSLPLKDM